MFLPLTLAGYFLIRKELRNGFLLVMSLLFYAAGEPSFVRVMLLSIAANYLLGLLVWFFSNRKNQAARVLLLFVTLDFFASSLGLFIQMLMPPLVVPAISMAMQFMFKAVFSMLGVAVLALCAFAVSLQLGLAVTAAFNLLVGTALFFLGALFLHEGQR